MHNLGRKWCIFPRVIQINTKLANFAGLIMFIEQQKFITVINSFYVRLYLFCLGGT
jgi:hypothetical protein